MIKPENAAQAFINFANRVNDAHIAMRYGSITGFPPPPKLLLSAQMMELLEMWAGHYANIYPSAAPPDYRPNQIAGCDIVITENMMIYGLIAGLAPATTDGKGFTAIPLFEPEWIKRGFKKVLFLPPKLPPVEWGNLTFNGVSLPASEIHMPALPPPIRLELSQHIDYDVLTETNRICFRVYANEKSTEYSDVEREAVRAYYASRARLLLDVECNFVWEPEISGIYFEDER